MTRRSLFRALPFAAAATKLSAVTPYDESLRLGSQWFRQNVSGVTTLLVGYYDRSGYRPIERSATDSPQTETFWRNRRIRFTR